MQTFDMALFKLYKEGKITLEEALKNADSKNNLRLKITLDGKNPDNKEPDAEASAAAAKAPTPPPAAPKAPEPEEEGLNLDDKEPPAPEGGLQGLSLVSLDDDSSPLRTG